MPSAHEGALFSMQTILPCAAALALVLASLAAVSATERAASRLTGPLGWGLALLLAVAAVWLLRHALGMAEAVAVAIAGLMAGIPLLATLAGWRQRRGGSDGRP